MTVAMPGPSYQYRARAVSNHDGDSVSLIVDLGFQVSVAIQVRVLGINAPELATPQGPAARDFVAGWLAAAGPGPWPLVIASQKGLRPIDPDKFGGRWDATIWRTSDGTELGAATVAAGFAKLWDGRGAKPV